MKTNKKSLLSQRLIIERKIWPWKRLRDSKSPNSGWIKAVRGALAMSTRQLADRLGIQQSGVTRLESREARGKVTLEMLDRAAKAMNCKLIYAIVPSDRYQTLEAIIDEQARSLARQLVLSAEHSMQLENQGTDANAISKQIERLASSLKSRMDSRIWKKRNPSVTDRND